MKIAVLCGARDYHALDWYHAGLSYHPDVEFVIVTDLIGGEGFKKLITESDKVYNLLILDSLLLPRQSSVGNIWRNVLKLVVLPIQVILLKRFVRNNPDFKFWAHSMYYMVLARASGLNYIATPQGSDILVKPYRSFLYKRFAIYGLENAQEISVDSIAMQNKIKILSNRFAHIIQNGIDISNIRNKTNVSEFDFRVRQKRAGILSIRGFTELYRIKEIINARNFTNETTSLTFIYPFCDEKYMASCSGLLKHSDQLMGRVEKTQMYDLMKNSELVVSIPSSDSSPKSVYEAICCGAVVAISYNSYLESLPESIRSRIVIVDLNDENWLCDALRKSKKIRKNEFILTEDVENYLDSSMAITKILNLFEN